MTVLSSSPTLGTPRDRTVTLVFTESCSKGELEVAYVLVLEGLTFDRTTTFQTVCFGGLNVPSIR